MYVTEMNTSFVLIPSHSKYANFRTTMQDQILSYKFAFDFQYNIFVDVSYLAYLAAQWISFI